MGRCCWNGPTILCAMQLSEIKALLGCVGERRYVMGCISQLEDGKYFLEDLSGRLQLDLTHAETTEGFYTGLP